MTYGEQLIIIILRNILNGVDVKNNWARLIDAWTRRGDYHE